MIDASVLQIHDATMKILAETGMVFHCQEAVDLAKGHGLKVSDKTVYFTEKQLMALISLAPARFTVSGPNPDKAVLVGDPRTTHFIPAGAAPFYMDEDDHIRDATVKDFIYLTQLFQASPEIAIMAGRAVQPADVKPDDAVGHLLYHLLQMTDKPFLLSCGGERSTKLMLDMVGMAHGGEAEFRRRPRFISVTNPLSPLQMDQVASQLLLTMTRAGQVICVAPCAMAGGTAPMTMAGAFVQTNAETLAGIAMGQMANPGAPMIYGFLTTVSDLKTGGIATGAPEQAISAFWGGKLARFYNLPCRVGGGGLVDAEGPGVQSAYESMMNFMSTALAGSHISFQSAGVLAAFNIFSPKKAVADLEEIGMVKRIQEGITLSTEQLALDVIHQVGPGGQYLTHPHTVKFCRKGVFTPHLSLRRSSGRSDWHQAEQDRLKAELKRRVDSYVRPEIPSGLAADLKKYLQSQGIDPAGQ